jgi:glutathionyl-hydroquinone reductase
MGVLLDGKWVEETYSSAATGGRFVRQGTQFRNWVTADGRPGPTGRGGFRAEANRYHLYVSLACPWANRTLIFRRLKRLEGLISVSVTHWLLAEEGWTFKPGEGVVPDTVNNATRIYEIYLKAESHYSGRASVPILWDRMTGTIVNNESADIIRMLNSVFDNLGAAPGDYYPLHLRSEIDTINARVYETLNNGVYRCGFASTQQAYDEAINPLFDTLDWLEDRLGRSRYLVGSRLTEADWRLFTTLVRFDAVYYGHFKCNLRRIADYKHLSGYLRDLYQHPRVADTIDFDHIKRHYYQSHRFINPTGIVPVGPEVDLSTPHGRG